MHACIHTHRVHYTTLHRTPYHTYLHYTTLHEVISLHYITYRKHMHTYINTYIHTYIYIYVYIYMYIYLFIYSISIFKYIPGYECMYKDGRTVLISLNATPPKPSTVWAELPCLDPANPLLFDLSVSLACRRGFQPLRAPLKEPLEYPSGLHTGPLTTR